MDIEKTDTPSTPRPEPVQDHWLYLGRRLNREGKVTHVLARGCDDAGFDPNDDTRQLWYTFDKPKDNPFRSASPGSVYLVHFEHTERGGHSLYTSGKLSPQWRRRWHDRDAVLRYAAEDDATEAHVTRVKREKESRESSKLREQLRPLRLAYRRTNAAGRAALLAAVISALTDSVGLSEE